MGNIRIQDEACHDGLSRSVVDRLGDHEESLIASRRIEMETPTHHEETPLCRGGAASLWAKRMDAVIPAKEQPGIRKQADWALPSVWMTGKTLRLKILKQAGRMAMAALTVFLLTSSTALAGETSMTADAVDILAAGSHADRIASYEGTKTCLQCHRRQALDVHKSVHYQWKGDTGDILGPVLNPAGKINGINDFCIFPRINWLGKLTNLDGLAVDGGCARCHAGLGDKPRTTATRAQLQNIDCLMCHSGTYKRKLEKVDGQFRFVPDTANMSVSILRAARTVRRPTKDNCLNCHTKAGGGDNYKRGDIEEAHRNPTRDFDVHMASKQNGGAGLNCTDCHTTINHTIAGRGSDLRERDNFEPVKCTNCHRPRPHDDQKLNRHTARVNCTVCHIPTFAKAAPTDMNRNWSRPGEVDEAKRLYDPHMIKRLNVIPEYLFFNGKSYSYDFGERAVPSRKSGRVIMSRPAGSVQDPEAKIHAFKHHRGTQPVDPVSQKLLPIKIGLFFETGNLERAVEEGVKAVGWPYRGYDFAPTERYMGIFHEVAPAEKALSCNDCHGGRRLDFAALGYSPRKVRNGEPLCSSCHGNKSSDFQKIHKIHVEEEEVGCNTCHFFSKASR